MGSALDDGTGGLTSEVLGAAFEVANTLGHGFVESVYRRALVKELRYRNLLPREEGSFKVVYKGEQVGRYVTDLVVNDRVIVELKAVETLSDAHVAQLLNYLRASGIHVGLLLNFGTQRLGYRRVLL